MAGRLTDMLPVFMNKALPTKSCALSTSESMKWTEKGLRLPGAVSLLRESDFFHALTKSFLS
jgi:hypothetical protein